MPTPQIVHHMGAQDGWPHPANTLEAIESSLNAGADVIETDITALADSDYLLVHDAELHRETDGEGQTGACSSAAARGLHVRWGGAVTAYAVPQLSDVVALFQRFPRKTRLQLDFKNAIPFASDEPLERLARLVAPLGERVLVSSGADWQLRRLRRFAPALRLGFDIMWVIDWSAKPEARDPRELPKTVGAYGYLDDHPIAGRKIWSPAVYLENRCEAMLGLVPGVEIWYVRHTFIKRCLDDGFNLAAFLSARGIQLDAWTMDVGRPEVDANAPLLRDAGVGLFTTNTPAAMRKLLEI
jgi:glycerophosphoryl diester phosphodiesterase